MFLNWPVLLTIFCTSTFALDNGLARKPPMGWMSWARFECELDCEKHPNDCINEQLYKQMADRLVEDGFKDAGYKSVHIDDCWMERTRDGQGRLVPDRERFPSGIAALADYMHERGLKLGIYQAIGPTTCAKFPGSYEHYEQDAESFASWNVDYLKMDGCNLDSALFSKVYPEMGTALNRTGHPIVYACSWPGYLFQYGHHQERINYTAVANWCNVWRNYDDIELSWGSVLKTIEWFTRNQDIFHAVQQPGSWNDPDMLIVGNPELTVEQARVQMSIWAIWSAPLIMSNDLRALQPGHKEILLNRRVISVNQDPLGEFGRMIYKDKTLYVYRKRVMPAKPSHDLYSFAIVLLNYGFLPIRFVSDLNSIGLTAQDGYSLMELWSGQDLGHFKPSDVYNTTLEPTSVIMLKATPLQFDL